VTASISFTSLTGLDTSSIITQLMSVESQPQAALKTKLSTEQSKISALLGINTAIASLSSSAASFATGSTWTQLTASSSNAAITVTASSSAVPSAVNVSVANIAKAASATLMPADAPAAHSALTIYGADGHGGTKALATLDSGNGSLSDMAAAINATTNDSKLRAVITKSDGGDVLQLVSTTTGAASNFDIRGSDDTSILGIPPAGTLDSNGVASTGLTTSGVAASLTVNGQPLHSDSNTVTIANGVQITLGANAAAAGANTATINVADNGSSRASALKAFIDQVNGVLTQIGSLTSYGTIPTDPGAAATNAGALPGDSTLRNLATQLTSAIFPADGSSLEKYGISVDNNGKLTFDSDMFTAAYNADPTGTQAAVVGTGNDTQTGLPLTDNFASRIQRICDVATYSTSGVSSPFVTGSSANYDGSLTAYIGSMQSETASLTDEIAAWDDRLAAKQASLETTYTALQTTLSKLQSQQSWLTSQISGLDSLDNSN
jgi:flagellar hook-associated protein 2